MDPLQQLPQGVPMEGIELLANGLLGIRRKGKSFRFSATARSALEEGRRDATQREVAFDRFLLAYLSRFQPNDLLAERMKDLDRPAIAPHPDEAGTVPVEGIGE
jgi:hypothetical protein